MRVCYFGIYDSEYSRNKILISGLRKNGVEVFECVSRKKGFSKYFDLIKKHRLLRDNYDIMIVGFPGFQAVILAKLLTSKPIVFDAFISIYNSVVLDRAQAKPKSLRALYLWYIDKISMSLADIVLFDTKEHIKYASKEFGIGEAKFRRIFVGADTTVFYPREKSNSDSFRAIFYGHYIPLQGVEYIVRSAKILENHKDIVFELIGDGQEKKKILDLAKSLNIKNINFVDNVSIGDLAEKIANSDVCLGIFGKTEKAKRVIPNKVYECVAMIRPVITADTPAIRELFTEEEIFLAKSDSHESIAEAILKVKSDIENAEMVAKKGFDKLKNKAFIEVLGLELKNILTALLK